MSGFKKCLVFLFIVNFSVPACASSDVWPTSSEWRTSFKQAAESPLTWVPLLGAAIIAMSDADKSISNWAYNHASVFGTPKNADRISTVLDRSLDALAIGTMLFMPQQHAEMTWNSEKGQYLLVELGAYGTAVGVTGIGKLAAGRKRPSGMDRRSFPSGHSTSAFAASALISRNIDNYPISPTAAALFKSGVYAMAIGVGWGRVETKAHYATDVLVGAAIGNFFASAIYNAFMNKPYCPEHLAIALVPVNKGFYFDINRNFA